MPIKTIEVLIGTALLFGTLFAAYSFLPQSPQQMSAREYGDGLLEALALDQNFRSMVAGIDSNELSGINAEISRHLEGQFSLQVCDSLNNCYGEPPRWTRYITVNYLYEGNATNYSPKTVYLHMRAFK